MQIDKQKVKEHFSKASGTYENSACVQYAMAKTLNGMIDEREYDSVLEIGCGTGVLSQLFVKKHSFLSLILNDLSDSMLEVCWQKFKEDDRITCLQADAENLPEIYKNRFSLIISNACFQWFKDLNGVLLNLKNSLKKDGSLIFSTFIEGNFQEISRIGNVGLKYLDEKSLRQSLNSSGLDYELIVKDEIQYFESVREMLRSFKKTGVTGLSNSVWTRSQVLRFIDEYESLYKDEKGVIIYKLSSTGWKAVIRVIMTAEIIIDTILRFAESSANLGRLLKAVIGAIEVIGAKTIAIIISLTIAEYGSIINTATPNTVAIP